MLRLVINIHILLLLGIANAYSQSDPVIVFNDIIRTYGDGNILLEATSNSNGDISYSILSGDVGVVELNGVNNENLSILGAGVVTIRANQLAEASFNAGIADITVTINKANLHIVATSQTREYGLENPVLTFAYESTDFRNGDDVSDIDDEPEISTTAIITSNVGDYEIELSGGTDNNYNFQFTDANLTITKAPLHVNAINKSREYGLENPNLTFQYNLADFRNDDDAADVDTDPVISTLADITSDVGNYDISLTGGTDSNYEIIPSDATLSVTKATLHVTAEDKIRTYGLDNPTLTFLYEINDFRNGDDVVDLDNEPQVMTTATSSNDAGQYDIDLSGGIDNNYEFDFTSGTLTIEKAILQVTAVARTREYGLENPELIFVYENSDFRNGDDVSDIDDEPEISTTAIITSNVGDYEIELSGGTDNNYNFQFTDANLTITKAPLHVNAINKSREYGLENPNLTFQYNLADFRNDDDAADVDTDPVISTLADITSDVGNYDISLTGGTDSNYEIIPSDATLSVTKATLHVTAEDKIRTYGLDNPTLTFLYEINDFRNGDDVVDLDNEPQVMTTATSSNDAGQYDIDLSGGIDNNYEFDFTSGTLTIEKAILQVTAVARTREYGLENPELIFVYENSDFRNGDDASVIDNEPDITTTAIITSNVGDYNITVTGGSDNNYNFLFTDAVLTITKAPLNVLTDNQSREYGIENPLLTFQYSTDDFRNDDDRDDIDTAPTIATIASITSDVGDYPISLNNGLDNNYDFVFTDATLSITRATLDVFANDQTREYGDANPPLTISFEANDFRNGDTAADIDLAPMVNTLVDEFTDVGTYDITLAGGSDNNYAFNFISGDLVITKATVGVSANNQTRIYGEPAPNFTITYNLPDFKNGENPSEITTNPIANTVAAITSDVGSYAINLSGGSDDNYDFDFTSGTLTITKAPLNVIADVQTREYGLSNPELTFQYNPSDFRNGDDDDDIDTNPDIATTAIITSDVGDYPISLNNGLDNNYDFVFTDATLSITRATLDVFANDQTREYGDSNPPLTISFEANDFRNGDTATDIDLAPMANTLVDEFTDAGTYDITVSGGSDNNYAFNFISGDMIITKATVGVSADDKVRIYGDPEPDFTITYDLSDFKNSDSPADINANPTANTTALITSDVGIYDINLSGGLDENYLFDFSSGNLTITKANLRVEADLQSREYGLDNPELTFQYNAEDFKNGDNGMNIDEQPVTATNAVRASVAGQYIITLSGGSDNNYQLMLTNSTLTVTQATLDVIADDQTREYGDPNPSLSFSYDPTDFRNGDSASNLDLEPSVNTDVDEFTNAGTYDITVSGGSDDNYAYNFITGDLVITKASLGVTADDNSRVYGDTEPDFTITYDLSDFKNTDTPTDIENDPIANTTADITSDVGTYEINLSGGLDENYTFDFTSGTLTITKADLRVAADSKTREYGLANPVLTFQYNADDFRNDDDAEDIDTEPDISTTAIITDNVGEFPITLSGGLDNNYDLKLSGSTMRVTQATLDIIADDQVREYGDPNPLFTISYNSADFRNDDTIADLDLLPSAGSETDIFTNAGTYDITVSGGNDNNYAYNFISGNLTIIKAPLRITANDQTRLYGDFEPIFGFSYVLSDFKNADIPANILDEPLASTDALITSDVGSYVINLSGGSNKNYEFIFISGTLTITKADLRVRAVPQTREYGLENPQFTLDYDQMDLRNSDGPNDIDMEPMISTTATRLDSVGRYLISLTGGEDNNYNLLLSNDTLSIIKATVDVFAEDKTREYGDPNPELTFSFDTADFRNDELPQNVVTVNPTILTGATVVTDVGAYEIQTAGGEARNYDFTHISGTLNITPAPLTVTVPKYEVGFTTSFDTVSFRIDNYVGFKNEETEEIFTQPPIFVVDEGTYSEVVTDTVLYRASNLFNGNYNISYEAADLIVHRWAKVDVQPIDQEECEGTDVVFSIEASASDEPAIFWEWRFGDDGVFEPLPGTGKLVLEDTVVFEYRGMDTPLFTIDSITSQLRGFQFRADISSQWGPPEASQIVGLNTLETPPLAIVVLKVGRILINEDSGRNNYQWGTGETILGDTGTKNYFRSETNLDGNANQYWSKATNSNGCFRVSHVGDIPNLPDKVRFDFDPNLSPNPSDGSTFRVQFQNDLNGSIQISILNQQGVLIQDFGKFQKATNDFDSGEITIEPSLKVGLYIVQITDSFNFRVFKRLLVR